MNRSDAKRIAETISNHELYAMLKRAKESITDWTVTSNNNKGCSKGVAWNILTKCFKVEGELHPLHKYNLIREFCDYLSPEFKPKKKVKANIQAVHQEPVLSQIE